MAKAKVVDVDDVLDRIKLIRAEQELKAMELVTKELNGLREHLKTLEAQRDELDEQIRTIQRTIAKALGREDVPAAKSKKLRSSPEELAKLAAEIVAAIKATGTGGMSAAALKAQFGKLSLPPFQFVEKFSGVKLKRRGAKANTIYSV